MSESLPAPEIVIRPDGSRAHAKTCGCTRCTGFPKGNKLRLKHGVYSPRSLAPRAAEIEAWCWEVAPWLGPADAPMVALFSQTMSRIEAAHAALGRIDELAQDDLGPYLGSGALPLDRMRRDVRAGRARR